MTVPLKNYAVKSFPAEPTMDGSWESPEWSRVEAVTIGHFYPESSPHRPLTQARLVHTPSGLAGMFRVEDRYVRSIHTQYLDPVYQDACVELFVHPRGSAGYFNFEFNCGGAQLCYYITDPSPVGNGFREYVPLRAEDVATMKVLSSMPAKVEPEEPEAKTWTLQFSIPFALLASYAAIETPQESESWRGNFYKCAENNSHPHWASWQPLPYLNFHQPEHFGRFAFTRQGGAGALKSHE